jgi:N-acetylmuramoyl-L-alanine amidase
MYVCIDPGHGGPDEGAVGYGAAEKWVTAAVALRTGALLHAAGCIVFLTRVGDRRVSLPQRLRTAQESDAELFLSLHCGQSPWPDQRGLEFFYSRGDDRSQRWAETVGRVAAAHLNGHTLVRAAQPIGGRTRTGSADLLRAVSPQTPACLAELGFLTNPHDARRLQQRLFLDDLARTLAAAVLAWRRQFLLPVADLNTETRRHGEGEGVRG